MNASRRGSSHPPLFLTERALQDIREIETYSIERWGADTAERYVTQIEAALDRVTERPDLLREEPEFCDVLRFYRVEKHVLVADVQDRAIYVLTLLHTSMDIPRRLAELLPQLSLEARLLHDKVASVKKKRQ